MNTVDKTWWYNVVSDLGLVMGQNCSWSGSKCTGNGDSTSTAETGCSTKRIEDLSLGGTPDIVVVFIGITDLYTCSGDNILLGDLTAKNHWPSDGIKETLSEAYGLMLSKILTQYPSAQVFCCSIPENYHPGRDVDLIYPVQNSNNQFIIDWNDRIRSLTFGYVAHFIDLHSCSIHYKNTSLYYIDYTHPNSLAMKLLANIVKSEILKVFY